MMDETLIGYLLDALDRDGRRAVEAYLRLHPEARTRLSVLRRMLEPLADDGDDPEPPPGLADRTIGHLAGRRPHLRLPGAPPPSRRQVGEAARRGPRRIDLVVAVLALALTAGLCMSWLGRQWRDYRVLACQNNLRQFWAALQVYADGRSDAAFPRVEAAPPRNFAGVFVPVLADAGALGSDVTVSCPARGRQAPAPCPLADLEDMARRRPNDFQALTRDAGGDYAYTLGYRDGDDVAGLRRDSGDLLPILADRPAAGGGNSPNHDGAGQNVLYIGGQVRWCAGPNVGVDRDDIYLNLKNRVYAGEHQFDSVLGPSDASPCPVP